jgi:hypothetical protein
VTERYLPLAKAAAQVGVTPAYVEMLAREGLVEVKRTLENVPVVSAREVERVRLIALLTEELDVNLPGAEVIVHMREDMIAMRQQFEQILVGLVAELKHGLRREDDPA